MSLPGLGIGALVSVGAQPGTDNDWPEGLGGVIVGPGNTDIAPYPGVALGNRRQWLVAFDPPAYLRDGRGPFDRASIPADLLTPLPYDPA